MQQRPPKLLREFLWQHSESSFLSNPERTVSLRQFVSDSILGDALGRLQDRRILIATDDQLTTALALVELDGVAHRLILLPPNLPSEQVSYAVALAQADAVVCGPDGPPAGAEHIGMQIVCQSSASRAENLTKSGRSTEWIMLTSGTTGRPKAVVHTLATLTAALHSDTISSRGLVWGTFYDIRRYGGLQILLRALLGGGSLVLSSAAEPLAQHLQRLARAGVTHISGTPTHWRWALINFAARALSPCYVRLSGEIADQAILDALCSLYPQAQLVHAYASTEAGVAFEVTDSIEGFPSRFVGCSDSGLQLKVVDGALVVRSPGSATHYLGFREKALRDSEGFVDTGDLVVLRDQRYHFVGRRGGIINVGGLKVHPEEVEAVINRHPDVHISLVHGRKNPITGAIVVADVVPKASSIDILESTKLRDAILAFCRASLADYKVPAAVRFVPQLDISAAGKTSRNA
jgi:acyl-CoA synthetase (AMP-forming)/AMP-acid ligase II